MCFFAPLIPVQAGIQDWVPRWSLPPTSIGGGDERSLSAQRVQQNHQNSHSPSEPLREPMARSARMGLQRASAFAHCSGAMSDFLSQ
jgi:hypothetical protein